MRLGIAQITTRAGDLERTCSRIVGYARRAASEGVDLLLFPMAALTGPVPVEESEQEGFLLDLAEALLGIADQVACPCVVPVVVDMDGEPAPEAMLIDDGEVVPLKFMAYVGALAASVRGTEESDDAKDGGWGSAADLPVITLGDCRVGVAFTYDDLDDFVDLDLGVDVVAYLAGYGFALDDPSSALGAALAENRYVRDAEDMDAWIVGVGSLGGYGTEVFTGSSFAVTPWGEIAAIAPAFEESFLVVDVDPAAEGPLADPLAPEVYNRPLHLWQALVLGLHDCLRSDVVLELDGSVQSLALAVLASDALGPTHVHALISPLATGERLEWCRELARNIRIDCAELGQRDLPATLRDAQGQDDAFVRDIVQAHLAALARAVHGVVLGHLDKTGLALEMPQSQALAGSFLPLGDVYRSDVLELAHMRNAISPVLPLGAERCYEVPEIEGLEALGTTDEERLRAIDLVLASHLEWERSLSEMADHGASAEFASRVLSRLADTDRLRTGRVLYIMATSRTLFDARRPLGLAWRDRYRDAGERMDANLMERIQSMGDRLLSRAGEDGSQAEREGMRDVLGYLKDFASGHGSDAPKGGPTFDGGWENPFSEN